MSIVALVLTPLVLLYQTWTYWVFRARLGDPDAAEIRSPLDLLERSPLGRGRPDPGG
jgi:cytochrome d ubiquinol oxidase subunit II